VDDAMGDWIMRRDKIFELSKVNKIKLKMRKGMFESTGG